MHKSIIGGIRETDIKEFTQLMNTDERATKYTHEIRNKIKLIVMTLKMVMVCGM